MNGTTGFFLNGELVCNATVRLTAVFRNPEDDAALWLLIEVNLGSRRHELRWRTSQLDALNLEREVPGIICVDKRGKTTTRALATYLRAQLNESALPYGEYIATTGWHSIDGRFRYISGTVAQQESGQDADVSPTRLYAPAVSALHLAASPTLAAGEAVEQLLLTLHQNAPIYLPVWSFSLFATMRSFLRSSGLPATCVLYLDGP